MSMMVCDYFDNVTLGIQLECDLCSKKEFFKADDHCGINGGGWANDYDYYDLDGWASLKIGSPEYKNTVERKSITMCPECYAEFKKSFNDFLNKQDRQGSIG